MELAGKVKVIFDKQTFGSGFEKREIVVTTAEQYPQDIKFEVYKEKCDMLSNFAVNEDVTVHFNLRGNEYNGKYFVNLNAWKIDKGEAGAPAGVTRRVSTCFSHHHHFFHYFSHHFSLHEDRVDHADEQSHEDLQQWSLDAWTLMTDSQIARTILLGEEARACCDFHHCWMSS